MKPNMRSRCSLSAIKNQSRQRRSPCTRYAGLFWVSEQVEVERVQYAAAYANAEQTCAWRDESIALLQIVDAVIRDECK